MAVFPDSDPIHGKDAGVEAMERAMGKGWKFYSCCSEEDAPRLKHTCSVYCKVDARHVKAFRNIARDSTGKLQDSKTIVVIGYRV